MVKAKHALFGLLTLMACESKTIARTQIMLVVDSDLTIPDELDEVLIEVDGPSGKQRQAVADLEEDPFPRSLALVHERGPLSPLTVTVSGLVDGQFVLERRASLSFVPGRTLVLPMHLVRECWETDCGEQTCTEQGCADVEVDPGSLDEWSGSEPTLSEPDEMPDDEDDDASPAEDAALGDASTAGRDAGDASTRDGGSCQPRVEQCNGQDDNCDGVIDDGFQLNDDELNCGSCGNVCRAAMRCCSGSCRRGC